MKKLVLLAFTAGLGLAAAAPAQALPVGNPADKNGGIVLAYGGCGPYAHPGWDGECRPGGQAGKPLPGGYMVRCPPGFRLAPRGHVCIGMRGGWRRW